MVAQLPLEGGAHGLQQHARLDGAAALRRDDHEGAAGVAHGEHLAHAHRRVGVQRAELHAVGVVLVVLGDGHGGLGGAALADEQDGVDARLHGLVGEGAHGLQVALGIGGQVGPAHVAGRARPRLVGELVERGVLRVDAAGRPGLHQGLCRGVRFLDVCGEHDAPLLSGQFASQQNCKRAPAQRRLLVNLFTTFYQRPRYHARFPATLWRFCERSAPSSGK